MEWIVLPESACYTSKALSVLSEALDVMVVNRQRMRKNMESYAVELCSEKPMFKIGEKIGKSQAYKLISIIFETAANTGKEPFELLLGSPEISRNFNRQELMEVLDPFDNTGYSEYLAQKILNSETT